MFFLPLIPVLLRTAHGVSDRPEEPAVAGPHASYQASWGLTDLGPLLRSGGGDGLGLGNESVNKAPGIRTMLAFPSGSQDRQLIHASFHSRATNGGSGCAVLRVDHAAAPPASRLAAKARPEGVSSGSTRALGFDIELQEPVEQRSLRGASCWYSSRPNESSGLRILAPPLPLSRCPTARRGHR
jgi:hypothetical protein